jgi:hypothetical protein
MLLICLPVALVFFFIGQQLVSASPAQSSPRQHGVAIEQSVRPQRAEQHVDRVALAKYVAAVRKAQLANFVLGKWAQAVQAGQASAYLQAMNASAQQQAAQAAAASAEAARASSARTYSGSSSSSNYGSSSGGSSYSGSSAGSGGWSAVAQCEEGGSNNPTYGYYGITEWNGYDGYPTAGSAPQSVQLQWEQQNVGAPPNESGGCHGY